MRSEKTQHPKAQRVHIHAYNRLRDLCAEIQKGRFPNKNNLARVLKRTTRTIQKDIKELRETFKAPIVFDRKQNGFRLSDPGWRLPPILLSEGELISFFAAERLLRRLGATAEVKLARDAVRSLAALLPDEVVIDLAALEQAISFAPEPVLDASPETLQKLAAAAAARETLFINYYSQHRAAHTERNVDVLLLHNHLGEWYAVCFDHQSREIRDFHAGRITNLARTRRPFTPPEKWEEEKERYLRRGFGMFRGGKDVTIEIEFDAYQARYARERQYHPTHKPHELPGGRLRVTFEASEAALDQVARWLMQYGEHAVAIRPAELREMMKERLQRTMELYMEIEGIVN